MALTRKGEAPTLWLPDMSLTLQWDGAPHDGHKTIGKPGLSRLQAFAKWSAERPESTIILAGHSLWFRSFFQLYLPPDLEHPAKKTKIVNAGVVGCTLQVVRDYNGYVHYRLDPDSIAVVYGGFATK